MTNDIYILVEHLQGQMLDISYMLAAQARQLTQASQLAQSIGGKVVAVFLGPGAETLTRDLAVDEVLSYADPALAGFSPEACQVVLAGLLAEKVPLLLLCGETSTGGEAAAALAVKMNLPLFSSCQSIRPGGAGLRLTGQICGGKLMVESEQPEGSPILVTLLPGAFKVDQGKSAQPPVVTAMAAPDLSGLKTRIRQWIEPPKGDVDISKEKILVTVGRGIQQKDNMELVEELAEALGGVVAASRPIVDQGWLPIPRLIGKSGQAVKPRLYLALGVSGAPEHVEAIMGSDLIIAVNTDPAAPIFNIARYGATVDILDLMPVLSEQVRQAKGG
jgi:electron transfer flavoprotein alpha subunit